jgi:hypothetical protein
MTKREEKEGRLARKIKKALKGCPGETSSILNLLKIFRLSRIKAGRGLRGEPSANDIRLLVRNHRWFDCKNGIVSLKKLQNRAVSGAVS